MEFKVRNLNNKLRLSIRENIFPLTLSGDNFSQGYIATITILIVMAVILAVTATASLVAIGNAQSSLSAYKGENQYVFTDGCAEDALLKSLQDNNYAGGNITRPEGTCAVTVSKNGTNWTIDVIGSASDYQRKVELLINRKSSGITLTQWQEI